MSPDVEKGVSQMGHCGTIFIHDTGFLLGYPDHFQNHEISHLSFSNFRVSHTISLRQPSVHLVVYRSTLSGFLSLMYVVAIPSIHFCALNLLIALKQLPCSDFGMYLPTSSRQNPVHPDGILEYTRRVLEYDIRDGCLLHLFLCPCVLVFSSRMNIRISSRVSEFI
jgi:hypothetical protein